jgi:hypothetical protein
MLELFYYSPVRIQALRDGPGGPALEDFAKSLVEAKYTVGSARPHIRAAEHFIYWAHQQGIAVSSLDAEALDRFNQHLSQCRCLGYSPTRRVIRQRGARMFLIRRGGAVVVRRAGAGPKTPEPPLFTAFRRRMQEQRGTHESTLDNYGRPILDLLRSIGDDPTQFGAEKLRQFILERYQRRTSGAIKVYVTALRMFVRFLIADGRCAADLDASIPSVAHWRDASLPQYLQPEEVERVISGCDPDFLVGRRDRAIFLLLARLGLRASDIVHNTSTSSQRGCAWKGSKTALPPLVERNGCGAARVVVSEGCGIGTRTIPQRSRRDDDSFWVRIHSRQVCPKGRAPLSKPSCKERIAPLFEAYVCPKYPQGHQRHSESLSLARTRPPANDRNIYACRSISEAGDA